ncbi:hypothetical protein FT663_00991 [Candidozyma haemuli var. vulneris]|uniref:Phospholipid/glycerol acyltransferase domain-containing protein n=1 Tax=Candidozyma haemuli TaxID=45357 RepID=A0A2V1AVG6_9ASCO|nr:hypothetical protein CXQ85_000765 [[Candida] haemuloni]KAF3994886.1 hypothetical protein FT663_00991 [[Candida] haemuloni var. vulneris]PVH21774.1 hypothetical protein CXQ85_000765 [[Candida] haemuloni]
MLSRHSWPVIVVRSVFAVLTFIFGCLSLRFTQQVAWALLRKHKKAYHAMINLTKLHFLQLLSFLTALINPSKITVTFDKTTLPDSTSFRVDSSGNLISSLSPNSVWISNHQIYTDWLFLWWLCYTGRFGDSVYIVLKAALAKIPVLGPGMENYKFLFLSRKWDLDKVNLTNSLLEIDADARGLGPASGVSHVTSTSQSTTLPGVSIWPKGKVPEAAKDSTVIWPYQMIIFPEGTVMSPHTRERSDKFAKKLGRPVLKHTLLPRVRGLFLMLRSLRDTVEYVYDVTCAYTGLTADDYGEEVFTLKAYYLKGYGPTAINYHIRAFALKDIPLGDDDSADVDNVPPETLEAFEKWLLDIWYEKDELMKEFFENGSFTKAPSLSPDTTTVEADFKLRSSYEILGPFMVTVVAVVLVRLAWVLFWKFF